MPASDQSSFAGPRASAASPAATIGSGSETALAPAWWEAALAAAAAAALCLYFIRNGWWGPDDGAYALVASQLLDGAIVHRDIQDIHPGYIHFINAAALALFGDDILSLRWPILGLTAVQAALSYDLLARRTGRWPAVAGTLVLVATGAVQFFNPTPNWYTLTLAIAIAWLLDRKSAIDDKTEMAIGLLVGLTFLLRQPTGVFVGFGAFLFILLRYADFRRVRLPGVAGCILLAMAAVIGAYLARSAGIAGHLLFGLGPLAVLLWSALRADVAPARVGRTMLNLAAGALAAALPLLLYHLYHASLGAWAHDVFLAPFTLLAFPFFADASFVRLPLLAAAALPGGAALAHVLYWVLMLVAAPVLAVAILRGLGRRHELSALPVIALFHALVSVYYEIPIYLYYTAGLTAVGLLAAPVSRRFRWATAAAALFVAAVALAFQAGQPLHRGLVGTALGVRGELTELGQARASVRVPSEEALLYARMLRLIAACTAANEPIFAYPTNAELYYLSDKKPPVRFFSTALGLRDSADAAALATWLTSPAGPRLVIHSRLDKYNSPLSDLITREQRRSAALRSAVGPFDVYYRSTATPPESCPVPHNGAEAVVQRSPATAGR